MASFQFSFRRNRYCSTFFSLAQVPYLGWGLLACIAQRCRLTIRWSGPGIRRQIQKTFTSQFPHNAVRGRSPFSHLQPPAPADVVPWHYPRRRVRGCVSHSSGATVGQPSRVSDYVGCKNCREPTLGAFFGHLLASPPDGRSVWGTNSGVYECSRCPLWVKSGRNHPSPSMSGFGGKTDEIAGKADIRSSALNKRPWNTAYDADRRPSGRVFFFRTDRWQSERMDCLPPTEFLAFYNLRTQRSNIHVRKAERQMGQRKKATYIDNQTGRRTLWLKVSTKSSS